MPQTTGISKLPYDAHLDYARRVGGGKESSPATIGRPQAQAMAEATPEPLVIDDRLAHFLDAGRPRTLAMYPGPPPMPLGYDVWGLGSSLLGIRPVRLWNGLKERHPSILVCLKMLRDVLREQASIWDRRHGMFGE